MRTLLNELSRRRVFRVAGIYGIVAWVVAEVADVIFPALQLPDWTVTFVIALLLLGFPVAMFFAWVFDIGPQGIERTEPLAERAGGIPGMERFAYLLMLGAAMAGLAYLLLPGYFPGLGSSDPATVSKDSIAVLPFSNLSQDGSDDYFSDGMSEELLNLLARVPGLRVAARTSSFAYKNKEVDVRDVARELGVETVLEGSVRRSGDRVRITAQLIDAKTGYHLWSNTYDRQMEDIFVVQDDISAEIVKALQGKLSGEETPEAVVRAAPPTENVEAYQLYLQARHQWKRRGQGPIERSIELLNQALALDPEFARAYSGLAAAYVVLPGYSGESVAAMNEKAAAAARQALARDPNLAEAHAVLAEIDSTEGRWADAEAGFFFATSLDPNDPSSRQWYSLLLRRTGRLQAALEQAQVALELDPTSPVINANMADTYLALGYDEKALAYRKTALDLGLDASQNDGSVEQIVALRAGDGATVAEFLRSLPEEARPSDAFIDALAAVIEDRDNWPQLEQVLKTEELPADAGFKLNVMLDRPQNAMDIVLALDDPGDLDVGMIWMPEAAALRRLPGFGQLVQDTGLLDYWKQYGWPDDCRPAGETVQCGFTSLSAHR
jgi:TolB-like protein/Tfp pilus assembly protein PilF